MAIVAGAAKIIDDRRKGKTDALTELRLRYDSLITKFETLAERGEKLGGDMQTKAERAVAELHQADLALVTEKARSARLTERVEELAAENARLRAIIDNDERHA